MGRVLASSFCSSGVSFVRILLAVVLVNTPVSRSSLISGVSLRSIASISFNVGTDIRVAYVGGLRKALVENPEKFDARVFINPAMDAVTALCEDKIRNVFNSAGHAND